MGATLPLDDEPAAAPQERTDHLYVALTAGRPAGGVRYALAGIDRVEIGRGDARGARRTGTTLRVDVADPHMSTSHVIVERERAHWVARDAGSRNGIAINGARHDRSALGDTDVLEAGRSFFVMRAAEPASEPVVEVVPSEPGTLATLDPALTAAFGELRRVAAAGLPVLVGGASGTGKERVAHAVHVASRRSGAFVPVNCGALPATLVESELFGHKRGAFSGAVADAPGLVASASGGTLFLDEIGDLPLPAQAALLRVLESHEVRPVGAVTATRMDLRIVAATHHDLDELVEQGRFRDDLVARLAGFDLALPSLAERRIDLGVIVTELLPAGAQLGTAAARALFAYGWPRNIRELARALERAVALAGGGELGLGHFSEEIATAKFAPILPPAADARRDELAALLEKHGGNVSKVAADLGRVRQQVQRWLKRYGLDPARYRS